MLNKLLCEERKIHKAGITINIYPVWKWLLNVIPVLAKAGNTGIQYEFSPKKLSEYPYAQDPL
jgi:hypothetical protein